MRDLNDGSGASKESKETELHQNGHSDSEGSLTRSLPHTEKSSEASPELSNAPFRYRPIRLHAQGGLGEVHIADDTELHREVALKRIRSRHTVNPEAYRRFIREAEITAQLQHPGVVPVYGLVRDLVGQPWYAMRFVEGQSLQDAMAQFHNTTWQGRGSSDYRLALRELLSRFVAVCHTMAYVHSRGIIHRDLKPENIMLGRFGETLVVDWGLARRFDKKPGLVAPEETTTQANSLEVDELGTLEGAVLGTPAFMSPEQAAGHMDLLNPASDIYSLGAILYALLTGQRPFQAEGHSALLSLVKSGQFLTPRQQNENVPRALECICLKAMALLPENRYCTVQDLGFDIVRWLSDEPVMVYRDRFRVRLRRWERRHQWTMPRVMGILVFVFCLFFFGMLLLIDSKRQNQLQELREELKRTQTQWKSTD